MKLEKAKAVGEYGDDGVTITLEDREVIAWRGALETAQERGLVDPTDKEYVAAAVRALNKHLGDE